MLVASTMRRRAAGAEGQVLLGGRELAMQRQHQGAAFAQCRLGAADLAHAGEEGEDVARVGGEGGAEGAGHGLRQIARVHDVAGGMLDRHGEHAARALDQGGVQQRGEDGGIERRGHGEETELGAEQALQVEAEGEGEVGFEAALVHLVQQDGGDALERGIGDEAADQQAVGHHLDPGGGADRAVDAGAVADGLADGLVQQGGHAGGGGPGGEATGFEHEDAAVLAPGCIEQRERDGGGLAGAGRGDEDGVAAVHGCEQAGQGLLDGEIGAGKSGEHGPPIACGVGRTI